LPIALFRDFAAYIKTRGELENIALGIDIREGQRIKDLPEVLKTIQTQGFNAKLIFLDASDGVLVRRFSETKHRHPLAEQLLDAIEKERALLNPVQQDADAEIDTSNLTLGELKEKISKLLDVTSMREMSISVISFGYKNGLPLNADLVMDVRFLDNPYYQKDLRSLTGLDPQVQAFIEKSPDALDFLDKFNGMILYLLPKYIKEGKSYLTIAIGCSGGRHRSVFMAHRLVQNLAAKGFKVSEFHRDVKIEKKEVW
jgi:UPF0042 nucleotide-binding protein